MGDEDCVAQKDVVDVPWAEQCNGDVSAALAGERVKVGRSLWRGAPATLPATATRRGQVVQSCTNLVPDSCTVACTTECPPDICFCSNWASIHVLCLHHTMTLPSYAVLPSKNMERGCWPYRRREHPQTVCMGSELLSPSIREAR